MLYSSIIEKTLFHNSLLSFHYTKKNGVKAFNLIFFPQFRDFVIMSSDPINTNSSFVPPNSESSILNTKSNDPHMFLVSNPLNGNENYL